MTFGAILIALTAPTCFSPGEAGQLGFEFDYVADRLYELRSGDRILTGTSVCADITGYYYPGDEDEEEGWYTVPFVDDETLWSCYATQVSGPATLDARCLRFDAPGEVTWSFEPVGECELPVEPEWIRFTVVTRRRSFGSASTVGRRACSR
ncbi:MAG: hypothetical protein HC927_03895, partial [Deltaproteobacteria bacterium]|nr:hypothetical protein [Deltaproteobacteria bacterium]